MKIYSLLIFSLIWQGCNENKNTDDDLLRIYITGDLPISPKESIRAKAAFQYGFYYYYADSDPFSKEEKSIQKHNDEVMAKLERKWGKGWEKRFEHSADSLYALDSLAIEIIKHDLVIQEFIEKIDRYNEEYNYYPHLDFNSYQSHENEGGNLRNVDINGYGVITNKTTRVIYLRAILDMSTLKIIEIDTTLRELPR